MELPQAPKEFSLTKLDSKIVELIEKNPNLPWLLRLAGGFAGPASGFLGQFDLAINKAIERKRIQNISEFLAETIRIFPSDTDLRKLESEFFIHSFDLISRAVLFTSNREKLKFFARLLKSAYFFTEPVELDEHEQLIRIVDEVSWREFEFLVFLKNYNAVHPLNDERHDHHQPWQEFRKSIMDKYELDYHQFEDVLIRLNRTGLSVYPIRPKNDMRPYYPHLTVLFSRLCRILED